MAIPTGLILLLMLGIYGSTGDAEGGVFKFASMLAANTPTGGDTGAHVHLSQILRDALLPLGQLSGWSNDWFAGFPVLYFYFPLPAIVTVLLDVFLPSGVALKIVISSGLIALTPITYLLVRWLGFDRMVAAVASSSALVFVLMESYDIYGGNIKSTLVGEFSFSWSFALALLYMGLLIRDARGNGALNPWPGIVLSLVTLSHVVSTIVVVGASALMLFRKPAVKPVVASWILGFVLSAFWSIPFGVRVLQGMTTDMGWAPIRNVIGPESPIPLELVPALVVGIVALRWVVASRETIVLLVGFSVIPLGAYFALPVIGVTAINNARLLPYWYYGVHLLAGIGLGLAVVAVGKRFSTRIDGGALVGTIVVMFVVLLTLVKITAVPGWVEWDFGGYEAKPDYGQYRALMETIDTLPPGRVMWEANADMDKYGSTMGLMLIPYWSEGHPSMEGLYFESSLTTPFHFVNASEVSESPSNPVGGLNYSDLDMARGIKHLTVYGVTYYISYTQPGKSAAENAGLERVAVSGPWVVFALPSVDLVEVGRSEPSVWAGDSDFVGAALDWYDDVDHLDRWIVRDGPKEWERVDSVDGRLVTPERPYATYSESVSDVLVEDQRISFSTSAIGVPHLVKVSYFPNWKATGSDGPYRAAPSLMVVIPTSEEVVLTFERTWVEHLGNGLTLIALAGLAVWWLWSRRLKRELSPDATAEIEVQ